MTVLAKVTGKIDSGWHIYALTSPSGGPTPTTVKLGETTVASGLKLYQPKPTVKFDSNFNLNVEAFEDAVTLLANVGISERPPRARPRSLCCCAIRRVRIKNACPAKTTLSLSIKVDPKASSNAQAIPVGYTEFTGKRSPASRLAPTETPADQGLPAFLLLAFGFGLAAIFTPCVFPMIPITLSFFLNKPGALRQAILFCLGIVFMFTAMGLLVTAVLGPVRRRAAWIESLGEWFHRR